MDELDRTEWQLGNVHRKTWGSLLVCVPNRATNKGTLSKSITKELKSFFEDKTRLGLNDANSFGAV